MLHVCEIAWVNAIFATRRFSLKNRAPLVDFFTKLLSLVMTNSRVSHRGLLITGNHLNEICIFYSIINGKYCVLYDFFSTAAPFFFTPVFLVSAGEENGGRLSICLGYGILWKGLRKTQLQNTVLLRARKYRRIN